MSATSSTVTDVSKSIQSNGTWTNNNTQTLNSMPATTTSTVTPTVTNNSIMQNTTSAAIYAAVGGGLGFGISHFAKSGKKMKIGLIIAGVVIGGIIGNNS